MQKHSDQELIAAYLAGDEKSLEILIKQYLKPIYSFVYHFVGSKSDAEDITQEVFVRIWRNIKKYDPKKSFKTWIFSIAKNASIDFLRKSRSASGGKKVLPFSEFEDGEGRNFIFDTLADPSFLPEKLIDRVELCPKG